MKNCYKVLTCTKGKIKIEVSLVRKNMVSVKSIANMRPHNRKQKKLWKQEAYSMKKVAKGLYEITQCCYFDLEMFYDVIKHVRKDEDGELWFTLEEAKQ